MVKIWKGDLMMRSKSLAKNKDLQRKVLCSLLAAGVMSVCISGGDVWASKSNEKIDLSGNSASTAYADWDMQIDSEGSFKGVYTHNGANLDFTGTETDITINNNNNVATAVANYGNNGGVMNFDAAKTSITLEHTGNVGSASPRDMGVLVNQGTVNFNGDALIKLNTANTATMYGVNVECNTNDAVPSIVNFNKKAAIDIVTGDAATGIFVSGKPGSVLASGDNLNITINAGGNINGVWTRYGGIFSTGVSNNLNINLQSDSQYSTVTGIKCFSQKEGQDNSHAGMIDIEGSATINVQSANKAYGILNEYLQRPVDTGKVKVAGDLNITVVGKEAYGVLSNNKDCDTNILGNANINVTGTNSSYAIHAKEGGQITVGSAGKTVALKAETTAGDSGKLAAAGVYALNGGQVTIAGAKADIEADVTANGRAIGVRVEGKDDSITSAVQLNADTTNIAVNGTTTADSNNFNEAAWVKNGSLTVNSKNLNVTGSMSGFTLEGLNVSTNGLIELNTEKTVIDIADDYGVTGITAHNGGTFKVNKGDLIITSTNTAANGVGKTNSIGIQSDEIGSGEPQNSIIIGPGVNKVDITVNGAGSEGATPNASNGTAGIYAVDGAIEIASGELNVRVNSGANVSSDASGVYSNATGIKGLNGTITVAGSTRTTLDVTDGYQEATGVYAGSYGDKKATVSILGDTAITATGKTGAHALYAEKGSEITIGSKGKMVALTGDVTAKDADSIITLAGDSNVVKGTVTADAGGIVLGGSDKATYTADKFVTKGAGEKTSNAKSGTITVSGGTLNIDNLSDINEFDLANNSLIVTGKGVLKAASDKVFEADTSGKKVIAGVDQKVLFNGGKLAISDASYTLNDSAGYSKALKAADSNGAKTTIVMTGTLQDQPVDNKATVDDLAPTGAVHTNVTGTVSTGTLNVGDGTSSEGATGVNNDLGVKDLDFSTNSGSGTVNASVTISNDTGLTLVGDGSSELLKGTGNSNNTVTVGSGSAGTLTLGNAAAESSGGTLNAAVTLQADSQMNVEAGSFTVGKITAAEGTVAVNAGANLTTTQDFTVGDASSNKSGTIDAAGSITAGKVDLQQGTVAVTGSLTANELSVGDSSNSKEGAVTAAGTVDVDTLNLNKGKVEVTGSLTAKTLTVVDSDAKIAVGAADSAGTLTAEDVKLGGASLMLDPAWEDSSTIQTASKAGLKFNSSQIDGKLTVGQNSVLSLGTADTAKAEAAFTDTGLTWGKNDITAALYIDYEQTMDSTKGGIKVDGSLTHASDNKDLAAANTATFAAGSLLMVAGDAALTTDGALKAGSTATITISNGSAATLKVDSGAKLYIADAQADKQYTIVSGFTNSGSDVTDGGWNGTNLLLNKLVKGSGSYSSGSFTVSTQKVKASEALPGVALPNILDAMSSQTDSPYAGIKYLSNAISGLNSNAQTLVAVNSFAQGAENSGATRTGALAALDLGTAAQEHLSLAKAAAEQSGGFGKAAVDTADNGSIWAQYIHNKDKVDNMGGVSYDGQYNGVIIGGDFADRGKYSSGMAFSYGSGDSTGSASKNEFDFWGLSYYGGIQNGDTNLIFDVGYSKTSSDVKGVIKAEPDTQVISMGIKGEKLISNGHGTSYVPYAGLRYMNIDTDSYNGSIDGKTAAHYSTDKADLWLLPVGISISHESVTAGGWKVRPTADIAYVWTLGDKNTAMDITVPGVNATDRLGYDIMDSGFFVGKLGLEAEKGDWTYGLGYACQKGSHAQNSKFMLNVTYSF